VDRGHIRIVLRAAARDEAPQIHRVLAEAFKPYRRDYTDQAYRATVVPTEEIERRIDDPQTDVLVAVWGTDVVGTATVLTKAIALYERFGFRRTGERKLYHGIVVFEMAKAIEPPRS